MRPMTWAEMQAKYLAILAALAMYKERGNGLPAISESTLMEVIAEAAERTPLQKMLKDE